VVEQNAYDGYGRLMRQQKFDSAGIPTFTRNPTYEQFDRVTNQSEEVGSAASISTRCTKRLLDPNQECRRPPIVTGRGFVAVGIVSVSSRLRRLRRAGP
jgi:hypothetical protein